MNVEVKELTGCEKLMTIRVSSDQISEAYDHYYEHMARVAEVPGFRPGKVPRSVLAVHYKDKARDNVVEELISHSLREALKSKDIRPIGNPEIRNIAFTDKQLSYEAYIMTRPQIQLGSYKGIRVVRRPPNVTESDVEEAVDNLRHRSAKFIPVEDRGLRIGDALIADLDVEVEGRKVESRHDEWIELRGEGTIPEFNQQILGAKTGEEKELTLTLPNDYARKDLAGKKGVFKIRIKEIKEKQLPPLNEEWAKEVGEYQSLEELKNALKSDIEQQKRASEERRIDRQILDQLLSSSHLQVPNRLVENRVTDLLRKTAEGLFLKGWNEEEVQRKVEESREDLRAQAERDVRLIFLFQEIARSEKIGVTQQEVQDRIAQIVRWTQQSKEKVEGYYSDEEARDNLAAQILQEKVMQFLRNSAEIAEKEM